MKYKFKKISQLPHHIQGNCYVITVDGHTMFPDDVAKRLNDLERALFKAPENTSSNSDYAKCKIEAEIKRLEDNPEGDYVTRISALEWALRIIAER